MFTGSTENTKHVSMNYFERAKHRIKRWLTIQKIAIIKKLDNTKYTQESIYESTAIKICCSLIRSENSILLGNMKTQVRYIRTTDNEMYIVVKPDLVEIINHTYHYPVKISEKGYDRICRVFDGHQDAERQAMDDQIRSNITHSLQTIYEKVKIK